MSTYNFKVEKIYLICDLDYLQLLRALQKGPEMYVNYHMVCVRLYRKYSLHACGIK